MESGNTPINQTTTPAAPEKPVTPPLQEPKTENQAPQQLPAKDPYDWKNYRANTQTNAPAKQSSGANAAAIVIAVISLLVAFGGIGIAVWALAKDNSTKTSAATAVDGYYNGNSVEFEETSIASIVSKVTPAVVSIVTETRANNYYSRYYQEPEQAAGTGMIVTSDGYVITNKHVAEGADSITIIMESGDTYEDVDIVGLDPLNDVAYLKINGASDLPTVTLGDSKTIAVGQPVLTIGNALGMYQNTVAQGIVSGIGRSLTAYDSDGTNGENLSDLIQTDAAINPGNSGGPLVNAAGEVIGINTATSTDYNGLGFSIPISATKGMLNGIIENGRAERAYIGVVYTAVTPEIAKAYNLPVKYGAYLTAGENSRSSAIASGGPAAKAGLKDGDIITKINGVQIGSAGSLSSLVSEYKVGDTIEIEYMRGNETYTTNLTLAAYKE